MISLFLTLTQGGTIMKALLRYIDSLFYRYAESRIIRGLPKASWMSDETHNCAVKNFTDYWVSCVDSEYESGDINLQERHDKIQAIWKFSDQIRA